MDTTACLKLTALTLNSGIVYFIGWPSLIKSIQAVSASSDDLEHEEGEAEGERLYLAAILNHVMITKECN